MEEQTTLAKTYTSVNVTLYFNEKMDEADVSDFVDNALKKYNHPDHVLNDYEWWSDDES